MLAVVLADGRNLVVGESARQDNIKQESGDALGSRGGESRVPAVKRAPDIGMAVL